MSAHPILGVAQFEPVVGDIDANLAKIGELAAESDADVLVLPELGVTGYDLNVATEAAAPIPGPLTDPLVDRATETDTWLVAGLPEREGDMIYNVLSLISPAGVEAVYRKQYPWGEEAEAFDVGQVGVVAETPVGRLGFLLCYDLNFPEAALEYSHMDVDALAVSAAWRRSFIHDWRLLTRARALDTTCYVAASNHTGNQRGREHGGHSLLATPTGEFGVVAGDSRTVVSESVSPGDLSAARERNPVRDYRRKHGERH